MGATPGRRGIGAPCTSPARTGVVTSALRMPRGTPALLAERPPGVWRPRLGNPYVIVPPTSPFRESRCNQAAAIPVVCLGRLGARRLARAGSVLWLR